MITDWGNTIYRVKSEMNRCVELGYEKAEMGCYVKDFKELTNCSPCPGKKRLT